MGPFDFPTAIDDRDVYRRTVGLLRDQGVVLPTFGQLADPATIPEAIRARLASVGPDDPDPLNLFRVHWHNALDRTGSRDVPAHVVLPQSLTGVEATIAVALGAPFPMIRAHKVLAAYACLVPRLVTGRFDPARQRAVWPSTGNYCRGGVAISRILGCRGVAVLPEGMSRERFDWLQGWVGAPGDIVRTPGTESNVKEIYDACATLARDPDNEIVNQFSEFGNYLGHYHCTGPALERIFELLATDAPRTRPAAFVAASGSAGTLGAGDYLKDRLGARIAVVEPVECPTLLYNGYGAHNIQGIGDKHVPLIHNVMNTDVVIGVSDKATDGLDALFNTKAGQAHLAERAGVPPETVAQLPEGLDARAAAEIHAAHLQAITTDHLLETTATDRRRIFNLGYFTWVEQQGVALEDFDARRDQTFWRDLQALVPVWDKLIAAFNRETRAAAA